MNENIVHEILHEVFSSLEALETQSTAILQLLKDKGLASEQELAGYLEQAGNASNVRWRAAQVRIEHLISSALRTAEREAKPEDPKPAKPEEESRKSTTKADGEISRTGQDKKEVSNAPQEASDQTSEGNSGEPRAEKNESQPAKQNESEAPRENGRQNAA